jgi:hypothetical protein
MIDDIVYAPEPKPQREPRIEIKYLTTEQSNERLSFCANCPHMMFRENEISYCDKSNLDINLVIADSDYHCPLENW